MKLREALITQSPSLELQRAASNEIARLDYALGEAYDRITDLNQQVLALQAMLQVRHTLEQFPTSRANVPGDNPPDRPGTTQGA